jgi:hypothetical protein
MPFFRLLQKREPTHDIAPDSFISPSQLNQKTSKIPPVSQDRFFERRCTAVGSPTETLREFENFLETNNANDKSTQVQRNAHELW